MSVHLINYSKTPSKGEQKIIDILKKEKIRFEREKNFEDLRRGRYRYDFFLPSFNILIEYQGEQHYQYISHFYKNKSEFKAAQERDRRKISFALARNIKIYLIPYWEIDKINTFSDLIKQKYLAKSKYHNDNDWKIFSKK